MAILKKGAERGELVNTLEEELHKTKMLLDEEQEKTQTLTDELDKLKKETK